MLRQWETRMANKEAFSERFRSFAERYVVARAAHFTPGQEQEQAWAAILDAKAMYNGIALQSKTAESELLDTGPSVQQYANANPYQAAVAHHALHPPVAAPQTWLDNALAKITPKA